MTTTTLNGHPIRLCLGSGTHPRGDGWDNIDRKLGSEVYPLDVEDDSVAEIYASHVLEHFSHRKTREVLAHWIDKLEPGGRLRIAVPDFKRIAEDYLSDKPFNLQGLVMGSHLDEDDRHGAIFDKDTLVDLLASNGMERISEFKPDHQDCSTLDQSLNLQAWKPSGPQTKVEGVRACISVPRFGPTLHFQCATNSLLVVGVPYEVGQSCYWHQMISELMERQIDNGAEYVLTLDYDTIFNVRDVLEIYRLMKARPDVDAICAVQSKRGCERALFSIAKKDGKHAESRISSEALSYNLLPVTTGHFGFTLFRAESLRKFPHPWMTPKPNDQGRWNHGNIDADIDFWIHWKETGFNLHLAPRIVVGHMEEMISWPGSDLAPVHQTFNDYVANGMPPEVER